jgi:hypothetical protein
MRTGPVVSGVSQSIAGRSESYGLTGEGVSGPSVDGRDSSDKVGEGVGGGEYKRFVSAKWTRLVVIAIMRGRRRGFL